MRARRLLTSGMHRLGSRGQLWSPLPGVSEHQALPSQLTGHSNGNVSLLPARQERQHTVRTFAATSSESWKVGDRSFSKL